jgi:hypothetical protein
VIGSREAFSEGGNSEFLKVTPLFTVGRILSGGKGKGGPGSKFLEDFKDPRKH